MTKTENIKQYLVGGAVRDRLLGLPVQDRDWVVVGATPEQMTAQGFKPVGADFPVFLHPQTNEEYALARTERKSGQGYRGFVIHTSTNVTLEEDLGRRDLTINAIAENVDGSLIDPFNGHQDIQTRTLRHVSGAFVEDPVRLLRAARFKARLGAYGFSLAPETLSLMKTMVTSGEVDALVPERVWQETEKALRTDYPTLYFNTLRDCGALRRIMPEIDALAGVVQTARWHPEIDTYLHTMMVLNEICQLSREPATRFAALCHDLGKALTPPSKLPAHHGHEELGEAPVRSLCARLKAPNDFRDLALLVSRYHTHVHRAESLRANTLCKTLAQLDIRRKPERFEQFLLCCQADARGRAGNQHDPYPQADLFRSAAKAWLSVDAAALADKCTDKSKLPEQLFQARTRAIKLALK